jgi:hypothetical protein
VHGVVLPSEVKRRAAGDPENDGSADGPQPADQQRAGMHQRAAGAARNHEIDHLADQAVPRNRVTSTLVAGMYSCLVRTASHRTAKQPPRSASSRDANTAGESNRGRQQHQSIVPSVAISAAVCRSPTTA